MPVSKRVVVDTNTIVSGILLPQSVPGRLLDLLAGFARIRTKVCRRPAVKAVLTRIFDRD